jgi:hypothetical protein
MATVSYYAGSWVGSGFDPGVEHYWMTFPAFYDEVVNITAHAVQRLERELMVKDIRTEVDPQGGRRYFFTVRNTGPNNIPGYTINHSFVQP